MPRLSVAVHLSLAEMLICLLSCQNWAFYLLQSQAAMQKWYIFYILLCASTLNHHLLLRKLVNIGLTSSIAQWSRSYLTNRSQITLLFLIYVNDLPDCHLASDIILYADYTVIYYSSKSVSDLEHHINSDLRIVSEWFSRNLLTLNISKCNFVII